MNQLLRPLLYAALLTMTLAGVAFGGGPLDGDPPAPTERGAGDGKQDREDGPGESFGGDLDGCFEAELPPGAQPFSTVLARNWDRWANGRARLTRQDTFALMAAPGLRGEDAAALATLEHRLRKAHSMSRAEALALDDRRLDAFYAGRVLALRAAKRTLFAPGAPNSASLRLGPAGDSSFLAALGWLAKYRPQVLAKALEQRPDGGFRVRFPGGEEADVAVPTDAELARDDSDATLAQGLWAPALEKAMGQLRRQASPKAAPGQPANPADVARLWTAGAVLGLRLGGGTDRLTLRSALARMKARGSLAVALLLHQPAAKLAYNHAYAVLDFDPATDMLTLWDPQGTDFAPRGPDDPKNGYARQNGVLRMGLDDFDRFFTSLAVEQN